MFHVCVFQTISKCTILYSDEFKKIAEIWNFNAYIPGLVEN